MAEPLKNLYNVHFFDPFCALLEAVLRGFDRDEFMGNIHDEQWEERELKDRMKHIRQSLTPYLSDDFEHATADIIQLIQQIEKSLLASCRLEFMFLPDYVAKHGIENFEVSVHALERITQFTSCEFAVRPFIKEYEERMMEQMLKWTTHKNHHVRRLASEGCRPRLPWAAALPRFKSDPGPILPILENLKNDTSEYVRRSVANNLNDISKDHPDLVLSISKQWIGKSAQTDRIVKHAGRTLLKKGDVRALELFGFHSPKEIELAEFECPESVMIGNGLNFSFRLINNGTDLQKLRIEYGVDYLKSKGSSNRKIFQVSEMELEPGKSATFKRIRSFQNMTTRTHYPGEHSLAILVNGRELAKSVFMVSG